MFLEVLHISVLITLANSEATSYINHVSGAPVKTDETSISDSSASSDVLPLLFSKHPEDHFKDYNGYPKYEFGYGVNDPHTGDHKSHHETRDGDVVKGYYTVADPDGTNRVVHYTADKLHGFNAVVQRTGQARHPIPVVPATVVHHEQELPNAILVADIAIPEDETDETKKD